MPEALPTKYAVVDRFIGQLAHGLIGKPPCLTKPQPTLTAEAPSVASSSSSGRSGAIGAL
jgi:hypothetical protein